MTFLSLNDTPSSYTGICPTILGYGIFLKIRGGIVRTPMIKRAEIIRECTQIVSQLMARPVIKDAQKQHIVPSEVEIRKILTTAPGCTIIAYM